MIGYTTIGTNDYETALNFYDQVLAEISGRRVFEAPSGQLYGFPQGPMFGVFKPYDGKTASAGNGAMIALNAGSRDKVDAVYTKAIALGAVCDGKPGPRGDSGFYGAYFRDLDGNKIAAFSMG